MLDALNGRLLLLPLCLILRIAPCVKLYMINMILIKIYSKCFGDNIDMIMNL